MGARKKKRHDDSGVALSAAAAELRAALPTSGPPPSHPLSEALLSSPHPLADVLLVDSAGAAGGAGTHTAAPTVWLSPSLMLSAGVGVGESVALAAVRADGGAVRAAGGGGSPARGEAMPLAADGALRPLSLRALCGQPPPRQPEAGDALLVARAWPAASLPPRHAAASAQLRASLGAAGEGARLRLVRLAPAVRVAEAARVALRAAQPPLQEGGASMALPALHRGARLPRALAAFAARYMHARALLPGNVVTLPVLGEELAFVVEHAEAAGAAKAGAQVGPAAGQPAEAPPALAYKVVDATAVVILVGDGGDEVSTAGTAAAPAAAAGEPPHAASEQTPALAVVRAALARGAPACSSQTAFEALGAASVTALREACVLPLRQPQLLARYGVRPPAGVLLHGPPGVGKTALARAAAREAEATLLSVSAPELVGAVPGESEAAVKALFAAARANRPALLFLDELDAVAPARGEGATDESAMEGRVLGQLLTEMDALAAEAAADRALVVVAATNRPNALDAALRRPGRFDVEVEVPPPAPAGRLALLRARLRGVSHAVSDDELQALAAGAHGFVAADLASLVDEGALEALREHVQQQQQQQQQAATGGEDGGVQGDSVQGGGALPALRYAHLRHARARASPSALREVIASVPDVRWEDVGGLADVKQRLREAVEWPQRHAAALQRVGARAPKGTLLYGPPGCSKTMLARAVATECGLSFISVKGPELFSKFVGESEKAIRLLFARARAAAPCVVFCDEIDSLAATRAEGEGASAGAGDSGVGARVLSQLLTEMDGTVPLSGVTILAATNRPDMVDPALLRPGRFDRLLRVRAPDREGREAVLRAQTRRMPLAADADLGAVAAQTECFTGADLAAVLQEAAMLAAEEGDAGAEAVGAKHLHVALARARPTPVEAALEAVYAKFERGGTLASI